MYSHSFWISSSVPECSSVEEVNLKITVNIPSFKDFINLSFKSWFVKPINTLSLEAFS